MRFLILPCLLAAAPALAHDATLPHAHTDWGLPVGLCLIAVAAVGAGLKARVARVRR